MHCPISTFPISYKSTYPSSKSQEIPWCQSSMSSTYTRILNSGCSRRNTSRTDMLVLVDNKYRVKSRAKHESGSLTIEQIVFGANGQRGATKSVFRGLGSSRKPVFTNVVTQMSTKVWAFSTDASWITCRKEKHGVVHVHGCSHWQSLDGGRVDVYHIIDTPETLFRSQRRGSL